MGCFDRLEPIKRRISRWRPSWTRSRPPARGREIGQPTNFRKESDPFASLTNVLQQRDSSTHELPSVQEMAMYRAASQARSLSNIKLPPDLQDEKVPRVPYLGLPVRDVSSTAHLLEGHATQA
ncbi:MAG: hypothetical protein Q9212_001329 [Teloschistes hypoglaucus]